MGKNARDQIPPPVVTEPTAADAQLRQGGDANALAGLVQAQQRANVADQQIAAAGLPPAVVRPKAVEAPSVTELAARALTNGAGMAREYAAAAGELCRTADTNAQARMNARRLLRLALAHLET